MTIPGIFCTYLLRAQTSQLMPLRSACGPPSDLEFIVPVDVVSRFPQHKEDQAYLHYWTILLLPRDAGKSGCWWHECGAPEHVTWLSGLASQCHQDNQAAQRGARVRHTSSHAINTACLQCTWCSVDLVLAHCCMFSIWRRHAGTPNMRFESAGTQLLSWLTQRAVRCTQQAWTSPFERW